MLYLILQTAALAFGIYFIGAFLGCLLHKFFHMLSGSRNAAAKETGASTAGPETGSGQAIAKPAKPRVKLPAGSRPQMAVTKENAAEKITDITVPGVAVPGVAGAEDDSLLEIYAETDAEKASMAAASIPPMDKEIIDISDTAPDGSDSITTSPLDSDLAGLDDKTHTEIENILDAMQLGEKKPSLLGRFFKKGS